MDALHDDLPEVAQLVGAEEERLVDAHGAGAQRARDDGSDARDNVDAVDEEFDRIAGLLKEAAERCTRVQETHETTQLLDASAGHV